MPHGDRRPVLTGKHSPQPTDVIRQPRQRELQSSDAVLGGLEAFNDGAPTGTIGPRTVGENDVRPIGQSGVSFLGENSLATLDQQG
jgi:hypothetical protein